MQVEFGGKSKGRMSVRYPNGIVKLPVESKRLCGRGRSGWRLIRKLSVGK